MGERKARDKARSKSMQQRLRDAAAAFAETRNVLVQELYNIIATSTNNKAISTANAKARYEFDMRIKAQSEALLGILENKERDVGVLETMSGAMSEELTGPFDFNTLLENIYQESKYIGKLAFVRHHLMPDDGEKSSEGDQEMLQYMSTLLFDYYKIEEREKAWTEANKYYIAEDGGFFAQAKQNHQETQAQLAKIISFLEDFVKDSKHKPIFDMIDIYMDLEFLRAQIHHKVKDIQIVEQ